jgi:DNA-binding transcriptional regulator YhcF (GntR family)
MKKKPGIQKAVDYISGGIASGILKNKLPPIKSLASAADVSFVTMWKAIDHLRSQGILSGTKQGTFLPGAATTVDSSGKVESHAAPALPHLAFEAFEPLWQKMLLRIKKDILTGRFQPGLPLPSHKELQGLYNVSYPTLKKVVETLSSQGIIKTYQRGYMVPMLSKSESTARIVAIGCGWEDGTLWIDYQDKNYFRILEAECIQSRLSLDIVVYCRQKGKLCFVDSITRKPYDLSNENILSFALIVANLEIHPEEVLQRLLILRKPVAVLDVVGGWEASYRTMNNYYLQLFTVTMSKFPPQRVGQYLLNLGHRNIAFLSPFHKALWSIIRYKGIEDMYRDAGYGDTVFTYTMDRYAFQWDFLQENHDNSEDIAALVAAYNKWQKYADSNFFRKFGHISYNISKYLTAWNCATGEIYHRMIPLFKRALENRSITAWVLANDYSATLALDYLKQQHVRVPEDLSVISFDNTLDAMEYKLTSYDFNLNGIVSIMLRYALRPSSVSSPRRKTVIEAEGAIIERRSTMRVTSK